LIASFHDSALGGHSGERVTYPELKNLFNWLAMKNEVFEFIRQCPTCQKNKSEILLVQAFFNLYPFLI
jgi:hypothetical protein